MRPPAKRTDGQNARRQIGSAGQQECRDLHSFPARRSSDLVNHSIEAAVQVARDDDQVDDLCDLLQSELMDKMRDDRSEARVSRNAEIYTLSLHDALPISSTIASKRRCKWRAMTIRWTIYATSCKAN